MVHGWFAGSPQAGKPVPTNSCGVQLLSCRPRTERHVGRADLDDRRHDLVGLDQLGDERRRLVRVVGVVLGDERQLVPVDAAVGVDLGEVGVEALGDGTEGRQRAGLGQRDADLEVLARSQLGGGLGRAVRPCRPASVSAAAPPSWSRRRPSWWRRLRPSSSPRPRSWSRPQPWWSRRRRRRRRRHRTRPRRGPAPSSRAARRASVLLFLMLALPLVSVGSLPRPREAREMVAPRWAGTPVAAWARSARTSSAPSGRSRRCHRASRRRRRSAGCRTARWPGSGRRLPSKNRKLRGAVAGRDEEDSRGRP